MRAVAVYSNDDVYMCINGKEFSVDVQAKAEVIDEPGAMYRRNGDPGDPPEHDFEITEIDAIWYELIKGEPVKVESTSCMEDYLCDWLYDHEDEFEIEGDE